MEKKFDYIIFLRVFCTICVLVNHIPLVATHVFVKNVSKQDVLVTTITNYLVHFAVPVFVMITGALLLNPEKDVSMKKSLKYAWRMIVVLLSVGTFFAFLENFSANRTFSFGIVLDSFCKVLSGNTWTHMWYLYMLIGLYLIIPFLKIVVNKMSLQNVSVLVGSLFFFTSVAPALSFFGIPALGIKYPISSCYVLYLLLGWLFAHALQKSFKGKKIIIMVTTFLCIVLAVIAYNDASYYGGALKFWEAYNSPLILLFSCCIFLVVLQNEKKTHGFV